MGFIQTLFGQKTPAPAQQQTIGGTGQVKIPGYNYNPYQVQNGDTFSSIAQKQNLTEDQIRQANGGMLIPPPQGSFINLPKLPNLQNTSLNQTYSVQPTGYDPAMRGRGYQAPVPPQATPTPIGYDPAMRGRGYETWTNPTNDLLQGNGPVEAQTIMSNPDTPPDTISPQALPFLRIQGRPVSTQDLAGLGYTFNQASGQWVRTGSAAAASAGGVTSTNNYTTNPRLRTWVWNKNAKNRQSRYVTNLKQALAHWKRQKQMAKGDRISGVRRVQMQNAQTTVAPAASNAGGTPQTVLDLHLGSG